MFVRELNEFEKFDCFDVLVESERFCEDVGCLVNSGYVLKVNLICCINFANVVEARINVLCSGVLDIVLDVVESRLRVREDHCWFVDGDVDGSGELAEKYGFFGCFA